MDEQSKFDAALPQEAPEQDLAFLIRKLQQQVLFLEKKIDTLIKQSESRPFEKKAHQRSYRSFGHSQDRFERAHADASQDKNFGRSSQGHAHQFGKRQGSEKSGFDQKKKPFYFKRKDRE